MTHGILQGTRRNEAHNEGHAGRGGCPHNRCAHTILNKKMASKCGVFNNVTYWFSKVNLKSSQRTGAIEQLP